ncbi:MAG: methyltransferase regulatory domain-containing protein [Isosphaeraceae bacterium]
MNSKDETSYDQLPYADNCFPYTHPDYLATIAALHGMNEPALESCRVLELGCAMGGNLMPMALELPDSRFVGIDLSPRQVGEGKALANRLGIRNLDLLAMSIADIGPDFGMYDYIVCHGVFSWVPAPIRDHILRICSQNLAPGGIAYISYNTYPGWHARGLIRDMLAYHVRLADGGPRERVARARAFLQEIVAALPLPESAFGTIVRIEAEFLEDVSETYLYHEHLEESNNPLYFHQFMDLARAHGLQFLDEAKVANLFDGLPHHSQATVEHWSPDPLAREQYIDFLTNRTFRRSLLSHAGCRRFRPLSADSIERMFIGTDVMPISDEPDVASDAAEEFGRPAGLANLTTNNPLLKAALVSLAGVRPNSLKFGDLWERVRCRLGERLGILLGEEDGPSMLREALLRCFQSNLVELSLRPPRFAESPGGYPRGYPLAVAQAERDARITNLRRRTVVVEDFDRLTLAQLDGKRGLEDIARAMASAIFRGDFTLSDADGPIRDINRLEAIAADELPASLERLARMALIEA